MASNLRPLLIEVGVEELPIHSVDELAKAFAREVCAQLEFQRFDVASEVATVQMQPHFPPSRRVLHHVFATPRRIAVLVEGVAAEQARYSEPVFGPPVKAGRDENGNATAALLGFAKKNGVEVNSLEELDTPQGKKFGFHRNAGGLRLDAVLPEIVRETAGALPVPKPMRWGDHDFAFVRPVHWLVMLHGDRVITGELFGLKSGRQSRGHRFMHPAPVHLVDADSYAEALRAAKVLADPAERRQRIRDGVACVAPAGCTPRLDDALLDELANLNEWPVAIACAFDRGFLAVPHEALVTTMRANQKFVPVFDADGKLTEHFIGVANLDSKDPAQIRHGYERVIRPRFADAKYFFDEDLKTPLASYQQGLRDVVWQRQLGSLWDKTVRVAELASAIAERLFAQGIDVDAAQVAHAAGLSRCDLMTRMIGEFPELQGVMGRHYAAAQDEPPEVANALDDFYRPRNAGDGIAEGVLAQCVSLADKLDTLAGIFAVGMKPTGNKDPFALRRAALGLARTLIEGNLDLELWPLLKQAVEFAHEALAHAQSVQKSDAAAEARRKGAEVLGPQVGHARFGSNDIAELRDFILDRLRGYYAEQGFTPQQFEAVAAVQPASLVDFNRRLHAVAEFSKQPEAEKLAAANKRVANILRKEGIDADAAAQRTLDAGLLHEPAERALAQALDAACHDNAARLDTDAAQRDYTGALTRLAQLQAPIDTFFDGVMVMAEDPALRANRVTLLARIKARFDAIAEIALL
ncbi:MAG: glycine--tRNA ligase subunit beta [Rhodanobacteraceae bacterium]|nr:MAG: glycine--tRNA ligase subunit beta [Rhodanobacteraceae bacterium]